MSNLINAMKPLLADLASSILFAALIAITGNIYVATGLAIALGIGQLLVQWLRAKPIARMQWASLGLVVVFGTLTLYFHDPRFVMVKFTLAHIAVGIVMLAPNWMSRYLPKIVTDTLPERATVPVAAPWVLFAVQYLAIRVHVTSILRQRVAVAAE